MDIGSAPCVEKSINRMARKCECETHEGDREKDVGEGTWWLKDPEWELWCPKCSAEWFAKPIIEAIKKLRGEKVG